MIGHYEIFCRHVGEAKTQTQRNATQRDEMKRNPFQTEQSFITRLAEFS